MPLPSRSEERAIWVVLVLVLAYGLYQAMSLAWVCDDAFISFRYAQNLVRGHGLVYNAGERVEGYTNFLWTLVMAAGIWAGLDPVPLSKVLGIGAFLFTASVLVYLSFRLIDPSDSQRRTAIPLAGMAVLLLYDLQVWATSGLETMAITALVTLGFAMLVLGTSARQALTAGSVLIAAGLTRPDGMIFYAMAVPYLLLARERRLQRMAIYLVPLVAIYVPYWLARYSYYGFPFPNTFYAKSVALPYYEQGLIHLGLYLKTYYILFLVPVAIIAVLPALFGKISKQRCLETPVDRALALGILMAVPYVLYVVRTGGDFMFARFFIPVTPICFVILEAAVLKFLTRPSYRLAATFAILACVVLRWPQFQPGNTYIHGIADERSVYPPGVVAKARTEGGQLKKYLAGKPVTVGFVGTGAMLMYYSELPNAIECHTGLTDAYIAHLPIEKRGRPGHEKPAPMEYLQRRGVNFIFTAGPGKDIESQHLRFISFGDIPAAIIVYDNALMQSLKAYPDVHFIAFPDFLDHDLSEIQSMPSEQRREFFEFSKEFYFDHNSDSSHFAALKAAL